MSNLESPLSCKKSKSQRSVEHKLGRPSLIHRVDRKLWNKAVGIIDKPPKHQNSMKCLNSNGGSAEPERIRSSTSTGTLMTEIRHSLLRHDWKSVHRLLFCLLDEKRYFRCHMNKVMITTLLASFKSSSRIINSYCNMLLSSKNYYESDQIMRTMCKLPNEIPRGRVSYHHGKLYVKTEEGLVPANSFKYASASIVRSPNIVFKEEPESESD